jgi:hypothetical protein
VIVSPYFALDSIQALGIVLDRTMPRGAHQYSQAVGGRETPFMLKSKRRQALTSEQRPQLAVPGRQCESKKFFEFEMEIMCGQIESGFCSLPGRLMSRSISAAKI